MKKIVILISGRGSNLEAILQALIAKAWDAQVVQVISNRSNAQGLEIANKNNIPSSVLEHDDFPTREAFDLALMEKINEFTPDLVILSGFMRILSNQFVKHFEGRLINIHPSLLPSFPGLKTHQEAIATGVKWHGATVHFVTPEMDVGPIICQGIVPVLPQDTSETLANRVLEIEHLIFPKAIEWFIQEALILEKGIVQVRSSPLQFFFKID